MKIILIINIKILAVIVLRLFLLLLINPAILFSVIINFILWLIWIILYIHTRRTLILIGFPSPWSFNGLLFFNVIMLTLFILVLVVGFFCFVTITIITVWKHLGWFHPLELLPLLILLRIPIVIIVSGYICVCWLGKMTHILNVRVFYALALGYFSKWQI